MPYLSKWGMCSGRRVKLFYLGDKVCSTSKLLKEGSVVTFHYEHPELGYIEEGRRAHHCAEPYPHWELGE